MPLEVGGIFPGREVGGARSGNRTTLRIGVLPRRDLDNGFNWSYNYLFQHKGNRQPQVEELATGKGYCIFFTSHGALRSSMFFTNKLN